MQNFYELHCNYKYIYEKIRHGINSILIESALKTKPISGGSGEGPEEPALPFFLDQTEARRAEKKSFLRPDPPPLISGYGLVWIPKLEFRGDFVLFNHSLLLLKLNIYPSKCQRGMPFLHDFIARTRLITL